MKLSSSQEEIVNFEDGNLLVKAGPGSGKTRVIIERIKRLLKTKKRIKILALTFSNLAAEEMKSRIEEDDSIENIEGVNVGTIHSFCLELLQKRYALLGFNDMPVIFESDSDKKKIIKLILSSNTKFMEDFLSANKPDKYIVNILNMISDKKRNFIMPDECDEDSVFNEIYRQYNDYLLAQNAVDFDDILFYAYKILCENKNVVELYNRIYNYYFVDEAQDLNYAQYMIIKTLCINKNNIMMVGDENQSIYGFNGSNSKFMCEEFVKDFNPLIITLYENFRSAKSIVRYANKLENTESETNYYYEGELSFCSFRNEDAEANFVVDKIKYLIKNGHSDIDHKLTYDDFAIISRNRFYLDKIATELKKNDIEFYLKKNIVGVMFDSELMNVFELSLRLIINDKDLIHRQQLERIVEKNNCNNISDILVNTKYDFLLPFLDDINAGANFDSVLSNLKEYVNKNKFNEPIEKEQILNDIQLYKKHWSKYIRQVPSESRNLASFQSYIALGKTQDTSNNKGVALLTAHMSKGLQYDVVFIVGACDGIFPDYRAIRGTEQEMEQERNNMFVAVTRAKRICYISYPKKRTMPWGDLVLQKPSRFIIDEKIIEN